MTAVEEKEERVLEDGKGKIPPALELSDVWFRYEKTGVDILRGVFASRTKRGILLSDWRKRCRKKYGT